MKKLFNILPILLVATLSTHLEVYGQIQPMLVKDILKGSGSSPVTLSRVGDVAFFSAYDAIHGRELWRSDGTAEGTFLVKDITPGNESSSIGLSIAMGDKLYFVNGNADLWKTDGTTDGTLNIGYFPSNPVYSWAISSMAVQDSFLYFMLINNLQSYLCRYSEANGLQQNLIYINGGYNTHPPSKLISFDNQLFYSAWNVVNSNYQAWKYNPTQLPILSEFEADINLCPNCSSPDNMTISEDNLFFTVLNYDESKTELWKLNKNDSNSVMVKRFNGAFTTLNLIGLDSNLFFCLNDSVHGEELWFSDGTENNTLLVKDIHIGPLSSNINQMFANEGKVYFRADDGISGSELWVSDGTENGTKLVLDINSGSLGSFPTNMVSIGQKILFAAIDSLGQELWASDGTDTGTKLVKDIWLGASGSEIYTPISLGDKALFSARKSLYDTDLWLSDGTTEGTKIVKPINPHSSFPLSLSNIYGTLYFAATDSINQAYSLWKSDGTDFGTSKVAEFSNINIETFRHWPAITMGGNAYFAANAYDIGFELWGINPNIDSVWLVKNICTDPSPAYDSNPRGAIFFKDKLYFEAKSTTDFNDQEIWMTDGTEDGTNKIATYSHPNFNTNIPPLQFAKIESLDGDLLLFTVLDENGFGNLWKTDGTVAGTTIILKHLEDNGPSCSKNLLSHGNKVYFSANTLQFGTELWESDGTIQGSKMIADINLGNGSSNPSGFIFSGNSIFFSADGGNGYELWKLDPNSSTPEEVMDFVPGIQSSFPDKLTDVNGTLFYRAFDTDSILYLMKNDGTSSGAIPLAVITPTDLSEGPDIFFAFGNLLIFSNYDQTTGTELWVSDGTQSGTHLLFDLYKGPISSYPRYLTKLDNTLYFNARDENHGFELWKIDLNELVSSSVEQKVAEINQRIVEVFPNPFSTKLNIQLSEGVETLQIFDLMGKQIINLPISANENIFILNTEQWNPGIYLIFARTPTETLAPVKLVKH